MLTNDTKQFLYYLGKICTSKENKLQGDITNGYRYGDDKCYIKRVVFNDPATVVYWNDGSKTVVKVQDGDVFDKEKGLAMAIVKKVSGNKGNYNNIFKNWIK